MHIPMTLNEQSLPKTAREKPQIDDESGDTSVPKELPGMRSLLTRRVCFTLTNYAMLAFTSIANAGIFPLFLFTPVHLGGLGFSEAQVNRTQEWFSGKSLLTPQNMCRLVPLCLAKLSSLPHAKSSSSRHCSDAWEPSQRFASLWYSIH